MRTDTEFVASTIGVIATQSNNGPEKPESTLKHPDDVLSYTHWRKRRFRWRKTQLQSKHGLKQKVYEFNWLPVAVFLGR